jgi:hypothetical protein
MTMETSTYTFLTMSIRICCIATMEISSSPRWPAAVEWQPTMQEHPRGVWGSPWVITTSMGSKIYG